MISTTMVDYKASGLFKGCLLGGLVGDCLGFPYENERSQSYSVEVINKDVQDVLSGDKNRTGERQYTDDTSMTISVAKFLLESKPESKPTDYRDLAKRFYMFYKQEPKDRGYGSHVHTVFSKLQQTNFLNAFRPASEQFNGTGSLGNGSGMRVAPIALYTLSDTTLHRMVNITINVSRITHTHPQGVVGGVFQTLAVRHGLLAGQSRLNGKNMSPFEILDAFEKDFNSIVYENEAVTSINKGFEVYRLRIQSIRKFIHGGARNWSIDDIKKELGVKVTASESIPTSLFCFLASFENIPFLKTGNQFERAIKLAISLGGDTDTVAAMCGNICGAYVGVDGINENLFKNCEDYRGINDLAEKLFKKCSSSTTGKTITSSYKPIYPVGIFSPPKPSSISVGVKSVSKNWPPKQGESQLEGSQHTSNYYGASQPSAPPLGDPQNGAAQYVPTQPGPPSYVLVPQGTPQFVVAPQGTPAQYGAAQQGAFHQIAVQQGVDQQGTCQHGVCQHGVCQHGVSQQGLFQHGVSQQGPCQHGVCQHVNPNHLASAHGTNQYGASQNGAQQQGTRYSSQY